MIKHLHYIVLLLLLLACNSENANDCFKTSGHIITQEIEVLPFTKIVVNEGIEMILREGETHEVVVVAGENLIGDTHIRVIDDVLILSNNNSCTFFHDYTPTKLYVTAPNITEIRSSTQFDIRSEGVLTYPQLHIVSEDYTTEGLNSGNFYLDIANDAFSVVFNNLSNAFISGETENLNISFVAGNSRFEGALCIAAQVRVFHRGSNDIIVHPTALLEGDLRGTGNVVAVNEPPVVNIVAYYKGKLIFQE